MRRGTTPTHRFTVDMDLRNATVYVTYAQNGKVVLERSNDSINITENDISFTLTQEETLKFKVGFPIQIQLRYVYKGMAGATSIIKLPVETVLKEGVIE